MSRLLFTRSHIAVELFLLLAASYTSILYSGQLVSKARKTHSHLLIQHQHLLSSSAAARSKRSPHKGLSQTETILVSGLSYTRRDVSSALHPYTNDPCYSISLFSPVSL
ncbi:hypothetical protein V8C44DRAFT_275947 [Trichoderma aethiopicum]